jgi:hypothetical protein
MLAMTVAVLLTLPVASPAGGACGERLAAAASSLHDDAGDALRLGNLLQNDLVEAMVAQNIESTASEVSTFLDHISDIVYLRDRAQCQEDRRRIDELLDRRTAFAKFSLEGHADGTVSSSAASRNKALATLGAVVRQHIRNSIRIIESCNPTPP